MVPFINEYTTGGVIGCSTLAVLFGPLSDDRNTEDRHGYAEELH